MKKAVIISLIIILTFAINLVSYSADNRGLTVNIKQLDSNNIVGKQWVVLIAINKYKNLNPLINPVKDAKEIRDILKSKYYVDNIIELYDNNASKRGIISLFNRLQKDVKTHDSLLIFYAGHGYLDKNSDTGFWMPCDAGKDKIEQDNWLTNQQIRGYLSNIESRHILLVSDSCFSGDILNPNRSIDAPTINNDYFANAYNKVSRQVLTSGASETVPDKSSFAMQFKLALKGNTNSYLDPLMMFNEIRTGVSGTTPMFGDLKGTGHQDGASFLLFLRDKEIKIETTEKTVQQTPIKLVSKTAEQKKMLITIEKSYGTLKVNTKTSGDLYLNNKKATRIVSGNTVTLANIETGSHTVEIKYKNNSEKYQIELEKDTIKTVNFTWTQTSTQKKQISTPVLTSLSLLKQGKIAFVSDRDGNYEIYIMNANDSNPIRLTYNFKNDFSPNWSPDGTKIAFVSDRDRNEEIYVMNADGSNQTRLTNNPKSDFSPSWSPDGTKIAFVSVRDGNYEIYVMNADGSNQTNITNNSSYDCEPNWSPDGTKIAFVARDKNYEIYIMNANDSNPIRLTYNFKNDFSPNWSPDGTKIAFQSDIDWNNEIYIMNADGSNQTNINNSSSNDSLPSWSPDGTKIAFQSDIGWNNEIFIMNIDGTKQTNITNNSAYDGEPSWSK